MLRKKGNGTLETRRARFACRLVILFLYAHMPDPRRGPLSPYSVLFPTFHNVVPARLMAISCREGFFPDLSWLFVLLLLYF